MTELSNCVVTGAFGYTGRYIARALLERGAAVRTITGRPDRPSPFGDRVEAHPFSFDDPEALTRTLAGADVLFNTYWVRFARGGLTHERAVRNIEAMLRCAREAGVRRVVHVSITNASADSALPYFRGKALAERAVRESGLSYAILRPALTFGPEDILLNNIAWLARRFPVLPVPGDGVYGVQPVFVEDLAELAVRAAGQGDDLEVDAVGPEAPGYEEMVWMIARAVGARCRLVRVPRWMAMAGAGLIGVMVRDVVLTRDEIEGLTAGLLVSRSRAEPPCPTRLSDWLEGAAHRLGRRWASEIARHYA